MKLSLFVYRKKNYFWNRRAYLPSAFRLNTHANLNKKAYTKSGDKDGTIRAFRVDGQKAEGDSRRIWMFQDGTEHFHQDVGVTPCV